MYRYLYCITRTLHKPLMNVVGIENAPVRTVQYEGIAAVVSAVTMAKIPVSNENALCHAAVIGTIQRAQTVLPCGFPRFSRMILE